MIPFVDSLRWARGAQTAAPSRPASLQLIPAALLTIVSLGMAVAFLPTDPMVGYLFVATLALGVVWLALVFYHDRRRARG